jgi:hypothetical protein
MSDIGWHSAKLRFVIMVEPDPSNELKDCVYLFRATDFRAAFERAIILGEGAQSEYLNTYGQRVIWRFMEVRSLDVVVSDTLDGAEICADTVCLDEKAAIPFDTTFNPRASQPPQTV